MPFLIPLCQSTSKTLPLKDLHPHTHAHAGRTLWRAGDWGYAGASPQRLTPGAQHYTDLESIDDAMYF